MIKNIQPLCALLSILFFSFLHSRHEKDLINVLHQSVSLNDTVRMTLESLAQETTTQKNNVLLNHNVSLPLFKAYPLLRNTIAHVHLGDLPTPISVCPTLAVSLQIKQLFVKQDNLTGMVKDGIRLFGGNKVRKLEFLLADALQYGVKSVITFGCAGSNHAIATAVYAREVGLEPIIMLKPQWNSTVVQRNLLLHDQVRSHLHYAPNNEMRGIETIGLFLDHKQKYGLFPYVIPTGGSNPIGILGYVNAAFELKEQIDAGLIPVPDRIYLPLGSAGTIVGLLLGLKAAGIKTQIIGVTVEPEESENEFINKINKLFPETNNLMVNADPSFCTYQLSESDYRIMYNCCGDDYALSTQQARKAINVLRETEHIQLDGTYTGKAFAGLISDAQQGDLVDKTVLFWNTFCDDDFHDTLKENDYHALAPCFHNYFEQEIPEENRV